MILQLQLTTRIQVNTRCRGCGGLIDVRAVEHDASNAGPSLGPVCSTCQTPAKSQESTDGEVLVAAYDYERANIDASGRRLAPLKDDWTEIEVQRSSDTHDQVHLSVTLEPPKLIVGVKPHTDARLHQLFSDGVGAPVRAALDRLGTRPDSRPLEFAPWETPYRDWVVVLDRGDDLVVAVPMDINTHLLRAFNPAAAEQMQQVVLPGGDVP